MMDRMGAGFAATLLASDRASAAEERLPFTVRAVTGETQLHKAGTTRKGAPLRAGVARILHNTRAVAVPVRVEGFRELLLHQQVPGKLFQECSIRIHPPLALEEFYAAPFERTAGDRVQQQLETLIGEPLSNSPAGTPSRP